MLRRRFAIAVAAVWLVTSFVPGTAQVPQQSLSDPGRIVSSLVYALQTGDRALLYGWLGSDVLKGVLKSTTETGIDLRLKELGQVVSVEPSAPVQESKKKSFTAKVTHQNGISAWTIAIDDSTERLITAAFQVSPGTTDRVNHSLSKLSTITAITKSSSTLGGLIASTGPFATITGVDRTHTNATVDFNRPSPTPSPPVNVPGLTPFEPRVVEFLFATTRKQMASTPGTVPQPTSFSGERNPMLTFGAASIRIPEDHKIGRIELPSQAAWYTLTFRDETLQEKKHFVIRKTAILTPEQWGAVVRAKAPKRALIFVHGFNNSFQDALFRNAQIVWDMQYPGLSVLFTWASGGEGGDYYYDRDSAYLAREGFVTLLKTLKATYGIEQVDVLAHSMGNLVVIDALSNYAQTSNPVKIGELIMAAPDVDRDQFEQMVPRIRTLTRGMTLYASSADKALILSRIPARVPRAGDVPPGGPIVLPNIETIDITAVGSEIFGLNHNEFAQNRVLIDDIKLILSTGMRPPSSRLAQIRGYPELPEPARYWRYAN